MFTKNEIINNLKIKIKMIKDYNEDNKDKKDKNNINNNELIYSVDFNKDIGKIETLINKNEIDLMIANQLIILLKDLTSNFEDKKIVENIEFILNNI